MADIVRKVGTRLKSIRIDVDDPDIDWANASAVFRMWDADGAEVIAAGGSSVTDIGDGKFRLEYQPQDNDFSNAGNYLADFWVNVPSPDRKVAVPSDGYLSVKVLGVGNG